MVLRKNNAIMAGRLLGMAKMLELQQWDHMSPMRQFCCLPQDIITKIEDRHLTMEALKEMDIKEIGEKKLPLTLSEYQKLRLLFGVIFIS